MRKILSILLAIVMLCTSFAFTANMAGEGGLSFAKNSIYMVNDELKKAPQTIEAVVYLNKRLPVNSSGGSVFGNYRGHKAFADMNITVESSINGGYPVLLARDGKNEQKFAFKGTSLFQSDWIHLTVVLDQAKKEARCYVGGELVSAIPSNVDFSKINLFDFVVGGDMAILNANRFNGKLKSLAVYSDVRTESEIKEDMTYVGTSDLMLHYDFSDLTESTPKVLKDLSVNKNNAEYSRYFFEDKEPVTDYAFSFAVVGDTQRMAINYPEHFDDIYNYIYDNINEKNIEMVIGMGDITDSFDKGEQTDKEWAIAREAFKIIDDYVPHIPIRGNHDSRAGYNYLMTQINYSKIVDGKFDNDYRNTYVDMEIGGIPYLFLNLDFALTAPELEWANTVCQQFPNHNIIISRHAHMSYDYTALGENDPLSPSYDFRDAGYLSGDAVWDGLIRKYENIVLVLSGHVGNDLTYATQRKGDNGNIVTEMLIDFQDQDDRAVELGESDNGLGIVNMFYFSEDGKTLTVETYSTTLGKYYHDKNQFTVTLDMHTNSKYVKPEKTPVPEREGAVKPVEIKMTINSKTAYVNGEAKTLDAAPIIKNSRTLLPVRFLAENLGAEVLWNDATKTATLKTSTTTIEVTINANVMKVNGTGVALDSPAIIENSRTYLPLRAIANALGVSNDNITWDDSTKTATFVK